MKRPYQLKDSLVDLDDVAVVTKVRRTDSSAKVGFDLVLRSGSLLAVSDLDTEDGWAFMRDLRAEIVTMLAGTAENPVDPLPDSAVTEGVMLTCCAACFSHDVRQNCDSAQDPHTGEWAMVAGFDNFCCECCGADCDVVERFHRQGPEGVMLIADLGPDEWLVVSDSSPPPPYLEMELRWDSTAPLAAKGYRALLQRWKHVERGRWVESEQPPTLWRPLWREYDEKN